MVWEDHLRTSGDLQVLRIDPLLFQIFHFLQKALRVHDDTGAYDADGTGIHDAARHETQRIRFAPGHDRVTRIISALGTDDYICFRRKIVYDLAFTFIAPLGTNYHCCCHDSFFLPVTEFFPQTDERGNQNLYVLHFFAQLHSYYII